MNPSPRSRYRLLLRACLLTRTTAGSAFFSSGQHDSVHPMKHSPVLHPMCHLTGHTSVLTLSLLALGLAVVPFAKMQAATTYTYSRTSNNTSGTATQWASGTNWNAIPVSGSDTILTFSGTLASAATIFTNNDIAGNFQLNRLNFAYVGPFSGTAPAVTISGNPLEFVSDGVTTPTLSINGTGTIKPTLAISNNIILTNALTIDAASGNTGTLSGVISGSQDLTKIGTGTLVISGANTYTGATKINGGTLNLTGSIASGSALAFGGGSTLNYTPTTGGSTQTFNGTTVNSGGATITNATAGNILNLGALTHSVGGLLNVSSLTGTTTTSSSVDSTGILGTWATTGSGTSLAYAAGGGNSAITAYTGTAATTAASVTDTTGAVNYDVAAAGTIGASASVNTLRYTGSAGTIAGNFTTNGLMNAGTGALIYSGNVTIGANKELVIVGNTQATTINGVIADNAGGASGLTYGGPSAGRLTLKGGHTLTGTLTVNSGTLDLWDTTSAYTNTINLAGTTATLDAANTATSTITINGNITGSGKISKGSGVSTLVLNGNNDFTGGVTMAGGSLVLGTGLNNGLGTGTLTWSGGLIQSSDNNSRTIANVLSMGSSAITLGATQGAVTGVGDLAFTNTTSTSVGGAKTWTVNNSTTVTFANNWSGNNGFNVTKAGTGTLVFNGNLSNGTSTVVMNAGTFILNGANAYTGATTINAGTLLVNGSVASAVTVNSTGTFGGSGTASGAATAASGSFLSAGASSGAVGTLTFGSTLDISGLAGGTGGLLFDLGATGASDKIVLTSGALTIGSGVLDLNDFSFTTLGGYGAGTYTLLSSSTTVVGTLGSNLTGTVGGLDAVLSISGNDLVLTVSAIPEPATYAALAGLGVLGLAVLRRRHARS